MGLHTPLIDIKGVGQKTADRLAQYDLRTVRDLLYFFPRRYEDFTAVQSIDSIRPGKVTIMARCEKISTRRVRRGMTVTTATLADDSGKLSAVWFNQPYRLTQLSNTKDMLLISGEFEFRYNRYQLTNPSVEHASDVPNGDRIVPIYRSIKDVRSHLLHAILAEIRPIISWIPETLPQEIVQQYDLLSLAEAMTQIHFPTSGTEIERARERIGFEEVFRLQLASQLNKREHTKLHGYHIPFQPEVVRQFVAELPFQLTDAQRRAAWDIVQDFERTHPMNRLVQGDVGSGKTVVAGIAMRQAAHAGYQSVLMAPTEILATQHADTLQKLFAPHGVTVGLLTGKVKGKARQSLHEAIARGDVDVIVGTHAVIQQTVRFHKLGFVVIDEQHRFGVKQRHALLEKSVNLPHLLCMTATPIPRSLALTLYGELDISVIDQRPVGRKPIKTKLWSPNSRAQLYEKIDEELESGRQAYVICSLIDNDLDSEIKSVEHEYKRLKNSIFTHRRIALLHGKLSSEEKERVMTQFARHEADILVSTTVVEVGVDVPNATVIVIENADRFGLSQLHQLRGRVGRSSFQSYAYLVMSDSSKPSVRLREIESSNDGFHLAEVDLRLRGPGEIYGKAQHGALNLQIASLTDTALIARAQKAARWFVESGQDLLQYKELAKEVRYYQRLTTLN